MRKTKKEIIIESARRDPFLKIDNLAEKAKTTPRYVKTILSEANVSLMKLRKNYARSMENREGSIKERLLINYVYNIPFGNISHAEIHEELIFNNPHDFTGLKGEINDNYLYYSYLHKLNRDIWSIDTIMLANKYYKFESDNLTIKKIVENITKNLKENYQTLSDIDINIELSGKQVSDIFKIPVLTPLFRLEQKVEYNSQISILMLSYFNPVKIDLSLSVNKGLIIGRKSITK